MLSDRIPGYRKSIFRDFQERILDLIFSVLVDDGADGLDLLLVELLHLRMKDQADRVAFLPVHAFLNLLEESQEAGSLHAHDCFLAKLTRKLNVGAPTVSHHVKELVNADLINTHKEGKQLICSINPAMVDELKLLFVKGVAAFSLPVEDEAPAEDEATAPVEAAAT